MILDWISVLWPHFAILIDQKGFQAGVEPKKKVTIKSTKNIYGLEEFDGISRDLLVLARLHINYLFGPSNLINIYNNTDQDPSLMLTRRFFNKTLEIDRLPNWF